MSSYSLTVTRQFDNGAQQIVRARFSSHAEMVARMANESGDVQPIGTVLVRFDVAADFRMSEISPKMCPCRHTHQGPCPRPVVIDDAELDAEYNRRTNHGAF